MAATSKKRNRSVDERALVIDVDGAGAMLDACRDTVYDLLHKRELDSFLQGRSRRITIDSIKRYLERKLAAAAQFERARHPTSSRLDSS